MSRNDSLDPVKLYYRRISCGQIKASTSGTCERVPSHHKKLFPCFWPKGTRLSIDKLLCLYMKLHAGFQAPVPSPQSPSYNLHGFSLPASLALAMATLLIFLSVLDSSRYIWIFSFFSTIKSSPKPWSGHLLVSLQCSSHTHLPGQCSLEFKIRLFQDPANPHLSKFHQKIICFLKIYPRFLAYSRDAPRLQLPIPVLSPSTLSQPDLTCSYPQPLIQTPI